MQTKRIRKTGTKPSNGSMTLHRDGTVTIWDRTRWVRSNDPSPRALLIHGVETFRKVEAHCGLAPASDSHLRDLLRRFFTSEGR